MKHSSRLIAAPAVLLLVLGLAACGPDDPKADKSKETPSSSPSSSSPSATESSEPAAGSPTTIPEYLAQEGIKQTLLTRDTDELTVDLPVPDGWSPTDAYADSASYGAVVLDAAADPTNPPRVLAILARLDGNADPAKILEYAPGELQAIDGFTATNMGESSTLGGFDAVQTGGSYTDAGQELFIAQKTVVIPGDDALYVLQLNAYALSDEVDALVAALDTIDAQTTIKP